MLADVQQPRERWMVWRNDPLTLYHGTVGAHATDIETNGIDIIKCRIRRDFGQGFYTTRREGQAIEFANHTYNKMAALFRRNRGIDPTCAAVVQYTVDRNILGMLDTLAFVVPDQGWQDFVKNCRSSAYDHKGPGAFYQVVYGPVSTVTGETSRWYEQLSFHSDAAIRTLRFTRVRRGAPRL